MAMAESRLRAEIFPMPYEGVMRLRHKIAGRDPLFPSANSYAQERGGGIYDAVVTEIGYTPDIYSMTAGCVRSICEVLDICGGSNALEMGAGISTLSTARYFRDRADGGGRVTSLEQDAEHAGRVRGWLADLDVSDRASVMLAPLTPCKVGEVDTATFDAKALASEMDAAGPFDLLVIDGPKAGGAGGNPHSRFPVPIMFRQWMADGALLLLDDAFRDMEMVAIKSWVEQDLIAPIGFSVEGKGFFAGRFR